jgi:hypothetical protein
MEHKILQFLAWYFYAAPLGIYESRLEARSCLLLGPVLSSGVDKVSRLLTLQRQHHLGA